MNFIKLSGCWHEDTAPGGDEEVLVRARGQLDLRLRSIEAALPGSGGGGARSTQTPPANSNCAYLLEYLDYFALVLEEL